MSDEIQLFADAQLKKPIDKLVLPRIPLGEIREYSFFIHNGSDRWPLHNVEIPNTIPEVKFFVPQQVKPNDTVEVKIKVQGALARREPIQLSSMVRSELWIG